MTAPATWVEAARLNLCGECAGEGWLEWEDHPAPTWLSTTGMVRTGKMCPHCGGSGRVEGWE